MQRVLDFKGQSSHREGGVEELLLEAAPVHSAELRFMCPKTNQSQELRCATKLTRECSLDTALDQAMMTSAEVEEAGCW